MSGSHFESQTFPGGKGRARGSGRRGVGKGRGAVAMTWGDGSAPAVFQGARAALRFSHHVSKPAAAARKKVKS